LSKLARLFFDLNSGELLENEFLEMSVMLERLSELPYLGVDNDES